MALIDTNSDPDMINYVIPGNDDALKSITLITSVITESIIDGKNQFTAGSKVKVEAPEEKEIEITKIIEAKDVEELIPGDIDIKDSEMEREKKRIIKELGRKKRKISE